MEPVITGTLRERLREQAPSDTPQWKMLLKGGQLVLKTRAG